MYTYAGSESMSTSADERGRGVGDLRKSPPSTVHLGGLHVYTVYCFFQNVVYYVYVY